jgi:manganese/iron transport system permease protein
VDALAWLTEPLAFDLTRRALLAVTLVGLACGAIGTFVVLRGLSFIGDALAHCVVPGVVVGYLTRGNLALWGALAALLSAWLIGLLARRSRVGGDASIAVVYSGMFALGLALISLTGSYLNDLTEILFGNVLAVNETDLWTGAAVAAIVLAVLVLLHRPLVLASFDPGAARALGARLGLLDAILYALVALTIVSGVLAVGSLLVTALLIVPAASARLFARRLSSLLVLAALLAGLAGWIGLYASYYYRVASGGAVVLAAVTIFALSLLLSPRGLPSLLARRRFARPAARPASLP